MFQEDDLVIAHLLHHHFPSIRTKLDKRKYGLFCVARKINDKAYVHRLLDNWNISLTFNMDDLFEYHLDDEELYQPNLRQVIFQVKETDVGWLCGMSLLTYLLKVIT